MLLAYVDDCLGNAVSVCGKKKKTGSSALASLRYARPLHKQNVAIAKQRGTEPGTAGVPATIFFS